MNFISKWFWKRAVRHEMLSAARAASLVAGLLLIAAGILGAAPLLISLVFGLGAILLAGRLKHRTWALGFLVLGLIAFAALGSGVVAEGGAALIVIAAGLGLASTFV